MILSISFSDFKFKLYSFATNYITLLTKSHMYLNSWGNQRNMFLNIERKYMYTFLIILQLKDVR